ncbi:alanine racemase [Aerococcaceae bacterium DSM 111021]|nr:alanine racemase [Aerococcaceae bacterium DSM 111021]
MIDYSDHRPTQAIVDLTAIRHNIKLVESHLKDGQQIYATVKANGYGHGAVPIARAALQAGATGLAVATVDEGIELRSQGFSQVPILILGLTDPRGIAEILHYNLTITVSHLDFFKLAYEQLEETNQLGLLNLSKLTFHLALDTGMGRIGLRSVEEVETFKEGIKAYPWTNWEGVFTHFATAGGGPVDYIEEQYNRWVELTQAIPTEVNIRHIANSGMGIWHLNYPTDIIRLGISMYGIDPKDEFDNPTTKDLHPALQLVSELIYVKKVEKGAKISYGATYETVEDEWIATIPIGYADGWLRRYQTISLNVDGQACPVVGTINMDQMMIRLPREYPIGTNVTLIGTDYKGANHASTIAKEVDTIGYEVLTSIGPRVPRVYLDE